MTQIDNDTGEVQAATDVSLAVGLTRAEVDQQIATAKQWPRSTKIATGRIMDLATLDEETSEECMYAVPRDGKTVEGPSARFAEIVAQSWGNCRVAARVVREERDYIVAQAVYHDLETNTAISTEVQRRVTKRNGSRYSPDMVVTTGNAACSIARRNIILAGVPKAVWRRPYEAARQVVMGDVETLANRRANALKAFQKFGALPEHIFAALGVVGEEDITLDHLVTLRGMIAALKNSEATVESMFSLGPKKTEAGPGFNPLVNPTEPTGGASTQTQDREQFSNTQVAETVTTEVDPAQVGQAGEMPATESNSSETPQPPAAQTDTAAPASDAVGAANISDRPGDDGERDGVSESTAPSRGPEARALPQGWGIEYAGALRRAQKQSSLQTYAKQFWAQYGSWANHKDGPDAATAVAIFDAFNLNFGNKDAIEAALRELV